MPRLSEFEEIVEGTWPETPPGARIPTADELTRALQVLRAKQVIYAWSPGLGGAYEIVRTYAPFFARYFGCVDYRLHVSPHEQMIALAVPQGVSRFDAVYERLPKDATIVLLALRLLWEEAVANQELGENGFCECTTADLADRLKTATFAEPPEEGRLLAILRLFQRVGAVKVGERDRIERVTPMSVLPGIKHLAPDTFVEELRVWAASPASSGGAPDENETEAA